MSEIAELLERFRRGPELLAVVLTGVFGEEEDFKSAPDQWSIRQLIAHLADSELVGAYRIRSVVAQDRPVLQAYDQNAWASNLDYSRRKPKQSLETCRRLRAENYEFLKELPESAFQRVGAHTDRGDITLLDLLKDHVSHVETHARQMQSVREEYKKAKGKN